MYLLIASEWYIVVPLSHWGRDKMAAIFQTIFSNRFLSSIGLDNGLAGTRRQAIIWTNDGLGYWRIYASLGLNELYDSQCPPKYILYLQ